MNIMNFVNIVYHSNIINFIIVVVFLIWVTGKSETFSIIAKRREDIKQKIKNAEKEKSISEEELETVKKRLSNTDQEVQDIIKDAHQIADSLADRIRKETDTAVKEANNKAERTIEIEKTVASNKVMQNISQAAFFIAEEHIKQAIDERLHRKYIDEFIDNLENLKV